MAAVQQQVQALIEEVGTLKNEIVNLKQSHAGLHQSAVESSGSVSRSFADIQSKVESLERKVTDIPGPMGKKMSLIEPKQINVDEYSGGMADARGKFLEWSEKMHDRVQLFSQTISDAMKSVERTKEPVSQDMSERKGVSAQENRELMGFIKDKTAGLAKSIVQANTSGVALETWRRLWAEFCPQTLVSTMQSQQKEKFPKPAKNMGELSKRLLEWERDLRRCGEEGRALPTDEEKRLALLRILPSTQRKSLWDTADQLFPTIPQPVEQSAQNAPGRTRLPARIWPDGSR